MPFEVTLRHDDVINFDEYERFEDETTSTATYTSPHDVGRKSLSPSASDYSPSRHPSIDVDSDPEDGLTQACGSDGRNIATGSTNRRQQVVTVSYWIVPPRTDDIRRYNKNKKAMYSNLKKTNAFPKTCNFSSPSWRPSGKQHKNTLR